MNHHVNSIANRLSLRTPQRHCVEILARVCQLIDLDKSADVTQQLELIRSEFPAVEVFERDFPSLCFALATGVGKTRLMGAFIAYLHRAEKVQHFFVLAPNLTIYRKLIADFTPNTPKYVFQGINEFAIKVEGRVSASCWGSNTAQPLSRRPSSAYRCASFASFCPHCFALGSGLEQFAEGNLSEAKAFAVELSQNPNLAVRLLLQTEHEILPRS